MRTPCKCAMQAVLPRGLQCDRGYLCIRLKTPEGPYFKACGPHTKDMEQIAAIALNDIRKQQYLNVFKLPKVANRWKFKQVRELFYKLHYEQYRNPSTKQPRTDVSKKAAKSMLNLIGKHFDSHYWDTITPVTMSNYLDKLLARGVTHATYNKHLGYMEQIYKQMTAWIELRKVHPIVMPSADPTSVLTRLAENKRTRIADTFELADVYTWCQENDLEFWHALESALLTALRKSDLVALDGSLTVKGIQQKTGEEFDLPITLERPVSYSQAVFLGKWNKVRAHMNWLIEPIVGHSKPHRHTTWHDLRHWAPTMLGEKGFSGKIIQAYTGHASPEMSDRYINIRRKALEPAVDAVRQEIASIKQRSTNGNNVVT
jgi:integrase